MVRPEQPHVARREKWRMEQKSSGVLTPRGAGSGGRPREQTAGAGLSPLGGGPGMKRPLRHVTMALGQGSCPLCIHCSGWDRLTVICASPEALDVLKDKGLRNLASQAPHHFGALWPAPKPSRNPVRGG